jgi:hypothetical protein
MKLPYFTNVHNIIFNLRRIFTLRLMQSCWLRLAALYSRFQALILIIFVAGMVDFMVYSDAVTVLVALPELMPVVIIALLAFGIFKYILRRKR